MNSIRNELNELPSASLVNLYYNGNEFKEVEGKKGVMQNDEIIAVVSKHYQLIQHRDAFKQALEQLEVPEDAKISCSWYKGKASMNVFFDELKINDGKLGIDMAFQIKNSYDGSTALGLSVKKNLIEKGDKYIVFYGLRQICSNGMKIKVPLAEMMPEEIEKLNPEKDVIAEEKQDIINNISKEFRGSVKHMGKKFEMKYLNLFQMAKLAVPLIEKKIKEAMADKITDVEFIRWLDKMEFSQKAIDGILVRYNSEKELTRWGAYNAITAYASHDVNSKRQEERLLDKAWELVRVPIAVKIKGLIKNE